VSARVYGGIPLSLMMAVTLLHAGAAASWWPSVMPLATLFSTAVAWVCGFWLLWRLDATLPSPEHTIAESANFEPTPTSRPVRIEQRRSPRFDVQCAVDLELPDRGRERGELRDISQGGARIAGIAAVECHSTGLLRIPGITLPVPFIVVGDTQRGEVRVRFELTGLTLDTFIRQFERLVTAHTISPALNVPQPASITEPA